jgi:hypothetical protein
VLNAPGGKIPEGPRELVTRHVFPLDVNFWWARDRNEEVPEGQTTLTTHNRRIPGSSNFRIDHVSDWLLVDVLDDLWLINDDPQVCPDLRGRHSNSTRLGHGVIQSRDQSRNERIVMINFNRFGSKTNVWVRQNSTHEGPLGLFDGPICQISYQNSR